MRSLGFIFSAVFILAGCDWRSSHAPSILVIAVESLNSESFFCGQAELEFAEGLGVLCNDGVRFTHAFAPSTMSQATLASMLTGLYPKDTGVWHNGSQFLSENFYTAPEAAITAGYRTAFFSGGPPIWRKSGLEQGFELFEDNLQVSFRELYRPVQTNFNLFLDWERESENGKPFFTVMYVPDLQFPNHATQDDLGQARARGFDGQLHEINESFAHLVAKMKQENIWDNTYVFLVGLNGQTSSQRTEETDATNLLSENTQVVLIIKPARKARDLGLEWSIDANVSLVDVGATLYDLVGAASPQVESDSQLSVTSLKSALVKPQVDWNRDRFILSESAWPVWRGVGGTRLAARQHSWLYIHDQRPLLYNTLTDRTETQPIASSDSVARAAAGEMRRYFESRKLLPWEELSPALIEKLNIYRDYGRGVIQRDEMKNRLAHIIRKRAWDKQLVGWLARIALEEKDWSLLEQLGAEHFYPSWVYVAKRRAGQDVGMPADICWQLLNKKSPPKRPGAVCENAEFIAFAEWVRANETGKRAGVEERFLRRHYFAELDQTIAGLNFENGLNWDTEVSIPGEPRLVELAMELPEFRSLRQTVENYLKRF